MFRFLKILNILDFRDHFPKNRFFWNFRGQKPKILKNRDSHLVELLIYVFWCFSFAFSLKLRLPQTREVCPIFDQKWRVVTSQNRPYLKKFPTDFKKFPRTMSNCCMRRAAKFHVDSAVRFWAIANIREGGRQTPPPPGQARVKRHSLPFQVDAVLKYLVVPLTFALDCTYRRFYKVACH